MKQISRDAHAKINLALDVTGRREDGYHLVRMIMQTVGIADELEFTRADKLCAHGGCFFDTVFGQGSFFAGIVAGTFTVADHEHHFFVALDVLVNVTDIGKFILREFHGGGDFTFGAGDNDRFGGRHCSSVRIFGLLLSGRIFGRNYRYGGIACTRVNYGVSDYVRISGRGRIRRGNYRLIRLLRIYLGRIVFA